MPRWLIIGGSHGLGSAFLQLVENGPREVFEISRTGVRRLGERSKRFDLCRDSQLADAIGWVHSVQPTHVFSFIGGGPFGEFSKHSWASHEWAFRASFLAPARIYHSLATTEKLEVFCFIGSAIAESSADPGAASYSAAKHALLGLAKSVWAESSAEVKSSLVCDSKSSTKKKQSRLLLFSPGYMATRMLPENSWPRQNNQAAEPVIVAEELYEFIQSVAAGSKLNHCISKFSQ